MQFRGFARRAAGIEAESADAEIVAATQDLLAEAGDDLPVVTRFVQGRVFPAWSSRTLDVGPALCYEAIARAAGPNVTADDVEARLAEVGEIGDVAASVDLGGQAGLGAFVGGDADAGGDDLTVGGVAADLDALAAADGAGSQDRKLGLLFGLFTRCSADEARYLARIVLGEMRIGVGEGTVRDAIAGAFDVPVGTVERALQVTNDYGLVAVRARDAGTDGLDALGLAVGRPVQAMLAQAGTVTGALDAWDEAVVETKFDGARVQVHYGTGIEAHDRTRIAGRDGTDCRRDAPGVSGDDTDRDEADDDGPSVRLFSRNMEDVTAPLPEIVETVEASVRPPAILDGEVVAVDDDGDPLPFQDVLRRFRRKHDVAAAREDVVTDLRVFDCLHAPAAVHEAIDPEPIESDLESDADDGEEAPTVADPDDGAPADAEGASANATLTNWTDAGDDGGAVEDGDGHAGEPGDGSDPADAASDADPHDRPREPGTGSEDAAASVDPDRPARPTLDDPDATGVDLLRAPLALRREYLTATVDAGVVAATVTDDADEIERIDAEALDAGHEGIMLKDPRSTYSPGRRGKEWLKRKPDVETLDLVVTGAEWGEGRRATFLGTFLLSARTEDGFAEVGKVATGITDETLAALTERLEPHVLAEDGQRVEIDPAVVFEVGYEELQPSPTYESGYALRFPRFVAVREDVAPDDADSVERIERLAEE